MSLSIPPLPPFQPNWPDFQVWWQIAKTRIEDAQDELASQLAAIAAAQATADAASATATAAAADATSALNTLSGLSSDNALTPVEKKQLIPIVQRIIDEKSGLDAQAATLSITTEKAAYDTAYTALTTYLGSLSPAYDDTSASTTIIRATFNTQFQDYYAARQALLNKMDDSASAQSAVIDPFGDVIVYASSAGVARGLPKSFSLTASRGNSNITAAGTWSRTSTSGVTCTIGASTGTLNITALSASDVRLPIMFAYAGITRSATIHIIRQDDPPTSSGGSGGTGGTSASTTTLADTTGTTYDPTNAISDSLTVTAGSGGQVQCDAPVSFTRVTSSDGQTGAYGKWQWRVPAGLWADIATEVQESATAINDAVNLANERNGTLSVTHTKTGLVSGSSYEFRFLWRDRSAPNASRVSRSSGALTATGS